MIKWPSATRQSTTRRSASCGAWTTRPRFATIAATRSAGSGASAGSAKQALHLVENRGGDLLLRRLCYRPLATSVDQGHFVIDRVEVDIAATDIVEDKEIGFLPGELVPCALEPTVAVVGCEAQ